MAAALDVERSFVRAPIEIASSTFRTSQKVLDKEMTTVVKEVKKLAKSKPTDPATAIETLDSLVVKLNGLKRKLDEANIVEEEQITRCRTRVEGLINVDTEMTEASTPLKDIDREDLWQAQRMDRILIDYMLRQNYHETASAMTAAAGLTEMVDLELFEQARELEAALSDGKCGPVLSWAIDNRSRLKKVNSTLEFELRKQEFVEYVRREKLNTAIKYARRYLTPALEEHPEEVQTAMALLAFPGGRTSVAKYEKLFDLGVWSKLMHQLRTDFYAVYGLPPVALLQTTLQAGLSVLKTPSCYIAADKNIDCPVCTEPLSGVAGSLPFAHHAQSTIVCRMSGEVMNEDNPPMVLPNGRVYSRAALEAHAEAHGGAVTCVQTGETFELRDAKKAYIS